MAGYYDYYNQGIAPSDQGPLDQPYGTMPASWAPAGDMNAAGAAADPFAYTQGSLLTPWSRSFSWSGGTPGGYTPPTLSPFAFGQADAGRVPAVQAQSIVGPREFSYADFQAPEAFKAPGAEGMAEDPGYQWRLSQGLKALEGSAAARGALRTSGTAKALQDYGQGLASQEYGNVYARRASEYDRNFGNAASVYGINRGNAAENFDRNWAASYQTQGANQNAHLAASTANAQNALGQNALGLQAWDRNYGLARTQWQDAADAANAAASAASGNSAADYNRALNEYQMARDEFWTNQDRQYTKLAGVAGAGQNAAGQVGNYGSMYGANAGNLYTDMGNARASGQVGAANAWAGGIGGAANAGLGAYYANQYMNPSGPPAAGGNYGGYSWSPRYR